MKTPAASCLPRLIASPLLILVFLAASASAKDLDVLTRYLIPAFLAQNFGLLCEVNDPRFLAEVKAQGISVHAFSDHIKQEITAGLSDDDARTVVLVAANTARDAARKETQKQFPGATSIPAGPLQKWCQNDARHYILQVIGSHFQNHEQALKNIERAKQ